MSPRIPGRRPLGHDVVAGIKNAFSITGTFLNRRSRQMQKRK